MSAREEAARLLLAEVLLDPGRVARAAARMALVAVKHPVSCAGAHTSTGPRAVERLHGAAAEVLRGDLSGRPYAVALGAAANAAACVDRGTALAERQARALMAVACVREVFRLLGLRGPSDAEILNVAVCRCDDEALLLTCRASDARRLLDCGGTPCGCPCHKETDS